MARPDIITTRLREMEADHTAATLAARSRWQELHDLGSQIEIDAEDAHTEVAAIEKGWSRLDPERDASLEDYSKAVAAKVRAEARAKGHAIALQDAAKLADRPTDADVAMALVPFMEKMLGIGGFIPVRTTYAPVIPGRLVDQLDLSINAGPLALVVQKSPSTYDGAGYVGAEVELIFRAPGSAFVGFPEHNSAQWREVADEIEAVQFVQAPPFVSRHADLQYVTVKARVRPDTLPEIAEVTPGGVRDAGTAAALDFIETVTNVRAKPSLPWEAWSAYAGSSTQADAQVVVYSETVLSNRISGGVRTTTARLALAGEVALTDAARTRAGRQIFERALNSLAGRQFAELGRIESVRFVQDAPTRLPANVLQSSPHTLQATFDGSFATSEHVELIVKSKVPTA